MGLSQIPWRIQNYGATSGAQSLDSAGWNARHRRGKHALSGPPAHGTCVHGPEADKAGRLAASPLCFCLAVKIAATNATPARVAIAEGVFASLPGMRATNCDRKALSSDRARFDEWTCCPALP